MFPDRPEKKDILWFLLNILDFNGLSSLKVQDPSVFAFKGKIYGVPYNQSSSIAFDETSSYWSGPKSSFLVLFIGHQTGFHWSAFRNHEGSTFTQKDRNKLNHQIAPGCVGRA